jgi:hypothetical protein
MRVPGSCLCPVAAVLWVFAYLQRQGQLAPGRPAFMMRSGRKWVPMTHAFFVGQLKKLLQKAGLDEDQYGGQSFRRGGATAAFQMDATSELIKLQGDWRSDCYQRYAEVVYARRLELPRLLVAAAQQAALRQV